MLHVVCRWLHPGLLRVHVGDSLWQSEEIGKNIQTAPFSVIIIIIIIIIIITTTTIIIIIISVMMTVATIMSETAKM